MIGSRHAGAPVPTRRAALGLLGVGLAAWAGGAGPALAAARPPRLFVPGYRSEEASEGGGLIVDQPGVLRAPRDWTGPRTLLSVYDPATPEAPPQRVAYPVGGHGVAFSPAGTGIFVSMQNYTVAAFDPDSLDLVALDVPARPDWLFGGHAVNLPGGRHVAISERAPATPASGDRDRDLARLGGRIVIRDALTLQPVGEFPSYGLRPHDLAVTADGRHLVVANYGSTVAAEAAGKPPLPHVVAPCATVIELASGRLVERIAGADPTVELRHLVAPRLDRFFAVTARLGPVEAVPEAERFPGADPGVDFLPSQPLRMVGGHAEKLLGEQAQVTRQGLSIAWDPAADEVLLAFPSSHTVAVFDGATGATRALIRTDQMGLRWPCGIAHSGDRRHWYISGYRSGLLTLEAGSHRQLALAPQLRWWGHSHTVFA